MEYKEAVLARATHDMFNAWIPDCFYEIKENWAIIKKLEKDGPQAYIKTIDAEIKDVEATISPLKEERNSRTVVGADEDSPFTDEEVRELVQRRISDSSSSSGTRIIG